MSSSAAADDDNDPKLPEAVLVDILKLLPVKTLLRFRCVCRSWRSTIDDPDFVALHLSHSVLDASNWYVACLDRDDPPRTLCSLFSVKFLALPCVSQFEIPFPATAEGYWFVNSCNGLVCVTDFSESGFGWSMYLWNLFTRRYKPVPLSGPVSEYICMDLENVAIGFGFDTRSNDYKIVRIIWILYDQESRVDVYSLGTNSWRRLECEVPAALLSFPVSNSFLVCSSSVFLNGNLHWIVVREYGNPYGSLVLFDVSREVFDEMAFTEEFWPLFYLNLQLCVLNDLLAVCAVHQELVLPPEPLSVCSVWVMREYGVPASWTKVYTFEAYGLVLEFNGFTSTGELLMVINNDGRVSWNPITGQFTNCSPSRHSKLVNVVESLVSL